MFLPPGWQFLSPSWWQGLSYPLCSSGLKNGDRISLPVWVGFRPRRSTIYCLLNHSWDFPGGSVVKNMPANAGDTIDWENPLEKEMATHSSILAWEIPWMEEPGGLHSPRGYRVRRDVACMWLSIRKRKSIASEMISLLTFLSSLYMEYRILYLFIFCLFAK